MEAMIYSNEEQDAKDILNKNINDINLVFNVKPTMSGKTNTAISYVSQLYDYLDSRNELSDDNELKVLHYLHDSRNQVKNQLIKDYGNYFENNKKEHLAYAVCHRDDAKKLEKNPILLSYKKDIDNKKNIFILIPDENHVALNEDGVFDALLKYFGMNFDDLTSFTKNKRCVSIGATPFPHAAFNVDFEKSVLYGRTGKSYQDFHNFKNQNKIINGTSFSKTKSELDLTMELKTYINMFADQTEKEFLFIRASGGSFDNKKRVIREYVNSLEKDIKFIAVSSKKRDDETYESFIEKTKPNNPLQFKGQYVVCINDGYNLGTNFKNFKNKIFMWADDIAPRTNDARILQSIRVFGYYDTPNPDLPYLLTNEEVVERYFENFNNKDSEELAKMTSTYTDGTTFKSVFEIVGILDKNSEKWNSEYENNSKRNFSKAVTAQDNILKLLKNYLNGYEIENGFFGGIPVKINNETHFCAKLDNDPAILNLEKEYNTELVDKYFVYKTYKKEVIVHKKLSIYKNL